MTVGVVVFVMVYPAIAVSTVMVVQSLCAGCCDTGLGYMAKPMMVGTSTVGRVGRVGRWG